MNLNRKLKACLAVVCLAVTTSPAFAQAMIGCGELMNGYGPFDYRRDKNRLGIVESYHFTPEVETLVSGKSGHLGGDLDYTLRAFPNHHRALMSMMKLAFREKTTKPRGAQYTVECYMTRAETFRPDDGMVKVIHALFLMRSGRAKEAVAKLEAARQLESRNANVHYNLGLAYLDLGQYDKALESAHRAYAAGFPLPGLRDKLKRAGKWREGSAEVVLPGTSTPGGIQQAEKPSQLDLPSESPESSR